MTDTLDVTKKTELRKLAKNVRTAENMANQMTTAKERLEQTDIPLLLRQARTLARGNLSKLARELDINQANLSRYAAGKVPMPIKFLPRLREWVTVEVEVQIVKNDIRAKQEKLEAELEAIT